MNRTYLQSFLSDSARQAKRSEIRELLKLIARPEVISLAGGIPSPEAFPRDAMAEVAPRVLREHGETALQYGPTEGDPELVHELAALAAADGLPDVAPSAILVTSGAQQGLDLCSRVFLAPGDTVVCGLPSFLGALGAFAACGARMSGIPLDARGMRTDLLEERLVDLRRRGVRPKMIYVVPDFQNPAGVTLSLARRHELLAIAEEFDVLVLEDSPYRALRYAGRELPSLQSLDAGGRVISLFTFSKILSPGMRLGWTIADPEIIDRLVVAKQPVDLCTSTLSQVFAREFLRSGRLPEQIERTRRLYARKREIFLAALEERIDPELGVRWTEPEGGLFLWMTLPEGLNAAELLRHALRENVAFVAGRAFHCDGGGARTLRLNFSYPGADQLQVAASRLARAIDELVRARPRTAPRDPAPVSDEGHALEQLSWNLGLLEVVE